MSMYPPTHRFPPPPHFVTRADMSHSPFFSPHLSHTLAFSAQDLARQRRLLDALHKNFISAVADGRGGRLRRKEAARLSYKTSAAASCWPSLLGPSKRTVRKMAEEVRFFALLGANEILGYGKKGVRHVGEKGPILGISFATLRASGSLMAPSTAARRRLISGSPMVWARCAQSYRGGSAGGCVSSRWNRRRGSMWEGC